MKKLLSRFPQAKTSVQSHGLDLPLLGIIALLSIFGLLMVYDASPAEAFNEFGDKFYYIRQQSISALIGFGLLGFFSVFSYRRLEKLAVPMLFVSIVLLLLVFVPGLGVRAGGAHRWLSLFGFTLQPAEIIKLTTVVFLAALFQKGIRTLPFVLLLGFVMAVVAIFQRDLGSAVVYTLIAFGVYFIAGARPVYFIGLLAAGAVGFIGFILTSAYRRDRVLAFLDPFADPQGFTYHIYQVLIALGSGGFWGVGAGQSRQKFNFIPEVTTDSIFSVLGEEFGFFGSTIFIAMLGFLLWRVFKIAQNAPDNFGKYLGGGLAIWLGGQAVVNLGAMVSLIPLTGVPLPFVSFGGSALIANLVAVGILLNISKQSVR